MANMKKIFPRLIFKICLLVLLGIHFYCNRPSLKENIFNNELPFEDPYIVVADSHQDIYLIDKRSRRIIKMSPNGEVSFMIKGGERKPGRFYRAADIAVDERDRLYVLSAVDNIEDGYTEKYAIMRYGSDGRYDKTIVEFSRTKEERLSEDKLLVSNINILDGWVYYFLSEKGIGTSLYRVHTDTGVIEKILTIPEELRMVNMSNLREGMRYITKLDGHVYALHADGTMTAFTHPDLGPDAMFFPWDVEVDRNGAVYVSDIANQVVAKIRPGISIEAVFPKNWSDGKEKVIAKSIWVNTHGFLTCINEKDNTVYCLKPDGAVAFKLKNGILPLPMVLHRFLIWAELFLMIIIWFLLLKEIFVRVLRRKIPLLLKQLFIFIPALILAVGFVSYEIFHRLLAENEKAIGYELAMYAQIGSRLIDGDALERITRPEHYGNADYKKVMQQMLAVLNYNKDPWNQLAYSRLIKFDKDDPYICVDWSGFVGTRYPFLKARPMHVDAYTKGTIGYGRYNDIDVGLFAGVAPIRNSRGKIVGVYELMLDESIVDETIAIFAHHLTSGILVSIVVFVILTSIITTMMLASIRKLTLAVSGMAKGNFDTTVNIRSRDEVEDLGRGFNIMSRYIRDYIVEITSLNKAYVRFVPQEFLHYLEKKSIVDMQLGDQVQKEMTILFADIRSFTALSEKMTPQQNFSFINSYLKEVGPVIRNNKGFIDKYIGDAIMALFPGKAEDALRAALDMKQKIRAYNEERTHAGDAPIDIGVGIHTGILMLGIIGEEERMEGTVISDSVNLASRIEGLTKVYGAGIIVSEETLKKLSAHDTHEYRFLDKVKVAGKQKAVLVFEMFGGDPDAIRDLKKKTKKDFEQGIDRYYNGKLAEAKAIFEKIAAVNKDDKAAALYVKRCENFIKYGIPADWAGIEEMTGK